MKTDHCCGRMLCSTHFGVLVNESLYPPQTVFVGGYTVFTLSEHPSVRPSVRLFVRNVLFPLYLEESLKEFHQIMQTYS